MPAAAQRSQSRSVRLGSAESCINCGAFYRIPNDLQWDDGNGAYDLANQQVVECGRCKSQYEVTSCDGFDAELVIATVQNEHRRNSRKSTPKLKAIDVDLCVSPHTNPDLAPIRNIAERRRKLDAELTQAMAEAHQGGYSVRFIAQAAELGKSRTGELIASTRKTKRDFSDSDIPF